MITLTPAAILHLKSLVDNDPKNCGFRLSIKKTGCSGFAYRPDIISDINPDDFHFTADGLHVYLDSAHLDLLKDITVDYIVDTTSGLKQKRLVFINPNEKNRCGCGESFTV